MAAVFPTPPVKKPTAAFQPRRGKIKAQIFGGIAEAVASAASRARDFLGLAPVPSPLAPPQSPPAVVTGDGDDGGALVYFIIVEKDP